MKRNIQFVVVVGLLLLMIGMPFVLARASSPTSIWSYTGRLISARAFHTETRLGNGKVLVVGGYNNNFNGNSLASVELYDPHTGKWSSTGSLNTARLSHTATLLNNGMVLVVGGYGNNVNGRVLASVELYDPHTGSWSPTGSLNTARADHTASLLYNGKVLVVGGDNNGSLLTSVEIYNQAT